jgi:hypothetical protein
MTRPSSPASLLVNSSARPWWQLCRRMQGNAASSVLYRRVDVVLRPELCCFSVGREREPSRQLAGRRNDRRPEGQPATSAWMGSGLLAVHSRAATSRLVVALFCPADLPLMSEGSTSTRWRALLSYAGLSWFPVRLREPLAGTTVQTTPGTLGHLPARFPQLRCMNGPERLGEILTLFRLTSEGPLVRTQLRPPSFCI